MEITEYTEMVIPNTEQGKRFAEEYKRKLYGAFLTEKEGTTSIIIESRHIWHIADTNEES